MEPITLDNGKRVFLGRQMPKAIFDDGVFRYILTQDGRLKRTLQFHNYIDLSKRVAAPIPQSTNWRAKAAASLSQVDLNDQLGDCVIASKMHILGVVSANEGTELKPTDAETLSMYHTICGPGDNGCVITDVLDYWKATGLMCAGKLHKIDDYVAVNPSNVPLLQTALELFGGAGCIGISLPSNWTCTDCVWPTPSRGSVGGHDVAIIDFDQQYVYISTWGGIVQIAWSVWKAAWGPVIQECYFALVPEWYNQNNLAPNGVDVATLKADLQLLANGTVPPIPDPTPPGPTPVPPGPTPVPPGPVTGNSLILTQPLPAGTYSIGTAGGVYLNPNTVAALRADLNQPPPTPTRTVTIPPFLLVILRALCAALAVKIPFIQLLCGLIPASAMAGDNPAPFVLTLTPELLQAIKNEPTPNPTTAEGSVVSFFKAELAKMEAAAPCKGCK